MQKSKLALALVVFLTFFSSNINAQWFPQFSSVTSQLHSIYFINQMTGIAAGDNGKIIKTTNGGTNWIASTILDTLISYRSIFFVNSSTGYIAGRILILGPNFAAYPKIIKTTDSGISWTSSLNDSNYTLFSISFINDNTGFAVGGLYATGPNKLLKTTNAGLNWQVSSLPGGSLSFITFKDVNTGFITGGGSFFKTTNSGINWNLLANIPVRVILSTVFVDDNTGFASGGDYNSVDTSGKIFMTVNGGNSWSPVYTDHLGMINDIKFVSMATGFAAGTLDPTHTMPGRILKTTNAGSNWFIDTLFTNVTGLTSLFFTDQNTGYTVGSNGVILKTTNGGNVIGITPISTVVPNTFYLAQNYPNPFNPETKIKFALPKSAFTKVNIYDMLGREVALLANEELKAGTYEISWNANNYPSGTYFYRIQSGDFVETKKMVLVK